MENLLKEITLIAYWTAVKKLIKSFPSIEFEHVLWHHVDALATLVSTIDIPGEVVDGRVIKKTLPATTVDLIPVISIDEQD